MDINVNALACVAAKWWRDGVERMRFENGTERTEHATMHGVLAVCISKPQDAQTLDKFEQILTDVIRDMCRQGDRDVYLDVDYDPCAELLSAARDAGMDDKQIASQTVFPCKTHMMIDTHLGTVTVVDGYRAPDVCIYPTT